MARGDVGWLTSIQRINLIFYHVGGNCYIGSDCERFPASQPTGDQWGDTERTIDLNDPRTRKIVVADLRKMPPSACTWTMSTSSTPTGHHLQRVPGGG